MTESTEQLRTAGYCRVSTVGQERDGISLEAQEEAILERAPSAVIYRDVLSGSTADRPGYQALMAAASAGEMDRLYVWKFDRLGRDAEERLRAKRMLNAAGVELVSLTGEATDTLAYGIDAVLSQVEREKISDRTQLALRSIAARGVYPAGAPPFGYGSEGRGRERRLVVEPAEAAVVRRIFEEYVSGVGVNRIAAGLNEDGIRTRRGAGFSARSILAVLPNRTYLGEICLKGETLATGAHEPIIDPETFAQAERLRAAKRSRPNGGRGRPAKRHLLDGLLYCANGHRMLARRWGDSEYYACQRKHTYGDCDAPDANRRRVDETLLHHFLIRHFDEDEMRERLSAAADEKIAEAQALAEQADREEQEAATALTRIKRDYVAGKISADDWNDLRTDLEEAQAASRNKAAQLRARAAEIEAEAAQVDVEAQLVARLGTLMRAVAGKVEAESPEAIAEFRAALTATFERIVYQPVWEEVPEGAPIVCGEAELAPVLRSDLLLEPDANSFGNAPWPPGRPCPAGRRWRTPGPPAGGGPRPRRAWPPVRRAHG